MENATKTLSEYYGVNVTETTESQTMSQHARTVVKEGNLYFSQSLNREINYTKEDVKYYWKNFSSFGLNLHKKEQLRTNLSLVHIYFKELGVVKYERDERYGIMDVIGNFTKSHIYAILAKLNPIFSLFWRHHWPLHGLQPPQWC